MNAPSGGAERVEAGLAEYREQLKLKRRGARELYEAGKSAGRAEVKRRFATLDFWQGFIVGGALTVAWVGAALLFMK